MWFTKVCLNWLSLYSGFRGHPCQELGEPPVKTFPLQKGRSCPGSTLSFPGWQTQIFVTSAYRFYLPLLWASLDHLTPEMTKEIHKDPSVDTWHLNKTLRCRFIKFSDLLILQLLIYANCMPGTVLIHGVQCQMHSGTSFKIWGFILSPRLSVGAWRPVCWS